MPMKEIRKPTEWTPARDFLPVILGKNIADDLKDDDLEKIELFEKGLSREIKKDDTIQAAVGKMVKMAIAAEFGPSLVAASGARAMIDTITRGIMADSELRKQALIIIDRFANG